MQGGDGFALAVLVRRGVGVLGVERVGPVGRCVAGEVCGGGLFS